MLWWKLQQLKSSKPEVRAEAAHDLGAAKQSKAVPSLIRNLVDDDPQVRIAVIEALGAIGHPDSAEPLASALANLTKAAGKRDSNRGAGAAEYESLSKALAAVGAPAVKPLLQLLCSEEKGSRRWAAYALGILKEPQAVDPLAGMLEDTRSEVRKTAALALGEIGDPRGLKALVGALGSRDQETRRAAAAALGAIGSESAVDALATAVGDQSELVQLSAIGALAKIGGLQAATCLRSATTGPRKAVCDAAKAAFKSMKFLPADAKERAEMAVISGDFTAALQEGTTAIPALTKALEFKDPHMRAKAIEALGSLRSPETVPTLLQALRDHNPPIQESAMHALVNVGAPALEGLEASLTFYEASVVRLAASAIGRIGNARSAAALVEMIAGNQNVSNEYPEMLDAVSAAVNSLTSILGAHPGAIMAQDLARIAELPDGIRLTGSQPSRSVDCTHLRNKAREELLRRP
jgi:HEAT repeat protein